MASIAQDQPAGAMRHRHLILGGLTLAYCLNYIDRQVFSILAPLIKAEFALSDTVLGFLSGFAFALFYSVLGIPFARLADRWSAQKVIVGALVVWSGMTFATAFVRSVPQMILCRLGVGVGEAGCTPPAHAIIARLYPAGERASAMSVYYFGATLGMALAFALGGWLGDQFGWRAAYMIVGLPGLVLALVLLPFLSDRNLPPAALNGVDHPGSGGVFADLAVLAGSRAYLYVVGGTCLAFTAYVGAGQWTPSFLQRAFGLPMTEIGLGLALTTGMCGGIGSLVGGFAADRLSRRDVRWQLWICAAACFAATFANFGTYLGSDAHIAIAWLALPAFLIGLTTGPSFGLVQALSPLRTRALAAAVLLFSTNFIGLGIGPQVVGMISDALIPSLGSDSLRIACLSLLVPGSLGAALLFWLGSRHLAADLAKFSAPVSAAL